MGNENKNSKYQSAYQMNGAKAAKKAPQKTDRTATFVLIAIVALLAVSLLLVVFADSGIKDRNTVIISSDNYEVSATVLPYFQSSAYSNLYYQYLNLYYSYLGDATMADQYASQMMQSYTPDDFFDSAYTSLQEIVVLCEAAKAEGISLTAEDKASIEESLASFNNNFAQAFGPGIKEKDVRRAMELEYLAGKYYDKFHEDKEAAVTDADIQKYIEANKADFFVTSYLQFDVSLLASDYVDLESLFESEKALADKYVTLIANAKTEKEFKNQVIRYLVDRDFDYEVGYYAADGLLPDEAALEVAKQEIITKLVTVIVDGGEAVDTDYTETLSDVYTALEKTCSEAISAMTKKQAYVTAAESEEVAWLIADTTKQYDTRSVDNSDDEEYACSVYMVTEALHLNDEKTVNVGHILVKAEEGVATAEEIAAAEKQAQEILNTYLAGEKTRDAFEKLGTEKTADSNVFYENVAQGDMVETFDAWIFSEDRKEVGETGIVKTEFGYHVMYWDGEGENSTVTAAKSGIVEDQYQEFVETRAKDLTLNEKYVAKHTAKTETEA